MLGWPGHASEGGGVALTLALTLASLALIFAMPFARVALILAMACLG